MPRPSTIPHAPTSPESLDAAPTRRRFLMGAAVSAAAAGAAGTAGHLLQQEADSAPATSEPADDKATGYRLTEHIRKYYKTTWI